MASNQSLPATMKAAQVVEFNKPYQVNQVPVPTPAPHQILLKIHAAGYCHTDNLVRTGYFSGPESHYKVPLPITGSHEPAGVVAAVGSDAEKVGFKVGERVGSLNTMNPCGTCADCRREAYVYCSQMGGTVGLDCDGAFAEYCLVDYRSSCKIPDAISFTSAAPLFCAGATVAQALKTATAGLPSGAVIGVIGLGALGHLAVQLARVLGFTVVGIDAREAPIKLAKELQHAPHLAINITDGEDACISKVQAISKDKDYPGLSAVIVTADPLSCYALAAKLLHKHGNLVVVGVPPEDIPFSFADLVFKDIRVRGSMLSETDVISELLDQVEKHGIEVKTNIYSFDNIEQMVHDAHQPGASGKFVVSMGA